MATYSPAIYPRRPKYSTLFSELVYQVRLAYYRYELNTGQYVMSPGEKWTYNMIVLSFAVLLLSAVYYYLPSTLVLSLQRLAYYFTGSHKLEVNGIDVTRGVIKTSSEVVGSLSIQMNASLLL